MLKLSSLAFVAASTMFAGTQFASAGCGGCSASNASAPPQVSAPAPAVAQNSRQSTRRYSYQPAASAANAYRPSMMGRSYSSPRGMWNADRKVRGL